MDEIIMKDLVDYVFNHQNISTKKTKEILKKEIENITKKRPKCECGCDDSKNIFHCDHCNNIVKTDQGIFITVQSDYFDSDTIYNLGSYCSSICAKKCAFDIYDHLDHLVKG